MKLEEIFIFVVEFGHEDQKPLSRDYRSSYAYILARSREQACKYAADCAKKGGGYWMVQDVRGPYVVNAQGGKRIRFNNGKVMR